MKPEWGMKRTCQSCGSRFYDLHRDPIHCPKCDAVYDPEAVLKTRRARATVAEKPGPKVVPKPEVDPDAADVAIDDEALEKPEDEEEDLIEDTSELGEDDDMAAVIDTTDEDEER